MEAQTTGNKMHPVLWIAAIAVILEDRREDGLRGLPPDAVRETVTVK